MRPLLLALLGLATACTLLTDGATRIAFDIERGAGRLGSAEGATTTVRHEVAASPEGCAGDYHIEFVRAGDTPSSLVGIWCRAPDGRTVGSHTTSYQSRFADLAKTVRLDKKAGEPLLVELERRGGRAVIVGVR